MAYNYLTAENIAETFRLSQQYTESLTDNFREYERIALNKPHASIPKEYPKTTDGTTASIIRKTPHRIIQQLPIGTVKGETDDWLPIVAQFIYTNKIIPNANEGYALLQKCWTVVERFLTFGYCPTYTPFTDHNGYLCSDLRLPYWGDIFVQPGKLSDADSSYLFLRSWWQEADIDALIQKQSKIDKKLRTWNVDNLRQIKKMAATKDEKAKTPMERTKTVNTKGGIELITGFQRGVGAKFITFHLSSNLVVRTKKNKDPRGEMPVSFAYGDIDGSNPFGRSVVDLVGGLQNLMDSEMQMYQYNRALQLNPPLIKRGNFNKNSIKFAPNTIIDVGSSPDANVEALSIDTTALTNFPNNYGLMKSQMLNLLASPDTSISADVGNPGFSKTPQGVEASRANLSVDDNYVRRSFEAWFERWSETAINIYFAEREGIEELQLDDETADELRTLETFDQKLLSPENKIRINYSTATAALKFEVTASSSQNDTDPAQMAIATGLLDLVQKYPALNSGYGGAIDADALSRVVVESSGINHPELIAPDLTREQKAQKAEAKGKPNPFSPTMDKPKLNITLTDMPAAAQVQALALAGINVTEEQVMEGPPLNQNTDRNVKEETDPNAMTPEHVIKAEELSHKQGIDMEKLEMDREKMQHDMKMAEAKHGLDSKKQIADEQKPVPGASPSASAKSPSKPTPKPTAPVAPKKTPEDQQLIDALTEMGATEEQIQKALVMLHAGMGPEEIMQMLQGGS